MDSMVAGGGEEQKPLKIERYIMSFVAKIVLFIWDLVG